MGECMRFIIILVFLACMITDVIAQDTDSANHIMNGCRTYIRSETRVDQLWPEGRCVGMVQAVVGVGTVLQQSHRFCPPTGFTLGQAVRVVLSYIDGMPNRTHEPFLKLMLEALAKAWPC
jgi:hypothetical protein